MQVSKWVTLGAGMVFILIVAAYLNAQHLYYMASILLTLPAVSYGLGWYSMRGLTFSREMPESGWAGDQGVLVYVAHNHSPLQRFFLSVNEVLPNGIEPMDTEIQLFNVSGRTSGADEGVGTTRVSHRVRFRKRGAYRLNGFDVTAIDPLGVFSFTKYVEVGGELVVYPSPEPLSAFTHSGADRYGWQEFTAAALRGASVDPDGVREYAPGDPLRRIHWRQTARTGRLAVIEFEEPQTISLVIALDLQEGTEVGRGADTTLEKGISVAASLAQQAVQAGASVRLLVPEDAALDEREAAAMRAANFDERGQEHLLTILDALARSEARSRQAISDLVGSAVGNLLPGTTLVIITACVDPKLPDTLTRYTSAQSRVGVIYVDPSSFERQGRHEQTAPVDDFFAQLLAVRAHPFLMHTASGQQLTPDNMLHGTF